MLTSTYLTSVFKYYLIKEVSISTVILKILDSILMIQFSYCKLLLILTNLAALLVHLNLFFFFFSSAQYSYSEGTEKCCIDSRVLFGYSKWLVLVDEEEIRIRNRWRRRRRKRRRKERRKKINVKTKKKKVEQSWMLRFSLKHKQSI